MGLMVISIVPPWLPCPHWTPKYPPQKGKRVMRRWDMVNRQTPLVLREENYAWAPTPTPPHCLNQETMYPPNISNKPNCNHKYTLAKEASAHCSTIEETMRMITCSWSQNKGDCHSLASSLNCRLYWFCVCQTNCKSFLAPYKRELKVGK
jgi:hypothetical protein